MTAKEKARELVDSFWLQIPARYTPINEQIEQRENGSTDKDIAKQCALIAVDEILTELTYIPYSMEYFIKMDYWREVKQEIINL